MTIVIPPALSEAEGTRATALALTPRSLPALAGDLLFPHSCNAE